jgi:uncharacterized protein
MAAAEKKIHMANWFEIPVNDLERAAAFYEKVFEVKLSMEEMSGMKLAMFPFAQGAPGASGALIKGKSYEPSHAGTVIYFSVESIDETLKKINANHGKTLMPRTSIGEHGFIAQYEDTEGNRLALHAMN